MRLYRKTALLVAAIGALAGQSWAATVGVSGSAISGWNSGNTNFANVNLPLPNTPVSATGLSFVSNAIPVHNPAPVGPAFAGAFATANVPSGLLTLSAGVQGSTDWQAHNPGLLTPVSASGQTKFVDSVVVQSSTLAAGTPVRVHLDLALAHIEDLFDSVGLTGGGSNNTMMLAYAQAYISSSFDGSTVLFSNDNKWFRETDVNSVTALGMFANGGSPVDIYLNTVVGRTLEIEVELDAQVWGSFTPYTSNFVTVDASGAASFKGALTFGASVTDLNNNPIPAAFNGAITSATGTTLHSNYFNGNFPDSSNANNQNAQLNLPAGAVPEPASAALLGLAVPALLRRRRRV